MVGKKVLQCTSFMDSYPYPDTCRRNYGCFKDLLETKRRLNMRLRPSPFTSQWPGTHYDEFFDEMIIQERLAGKIKVMTTTKASAFQKLPLLEVFSNSVLCSKVSETTGRLVNLSFLIIFHRFSICRVRWSPH